jgi:hypothetical protein
VREREEKTWELVKDTNFRNGGRKCSCFEGFQAISLILLVEISKDYKALFLSGR